MLLLVGTIYHETPKHDSIVCVQQTRVKYSTNGQKVQITMTAKKTTHPQLSQGDEAQIQLLLARRQAIAEELHSSTSRAQAEEVLAAAFAADEATQVGLLKSLARAHDVDSADVLLAIHELAPVKAVRKEARRALIQLAGAKI